MSERLLQDTQNDTPPPAVEEPLTPYAPPANAAPAGASFAPTGVALVDRLLTTVDRLSGGRAGLVQRVVSYLIFGGFAAVVNLIALYVLKSVVQLPVSNTVHYAIAQVLATEISIMANFIPNDRYTFSRL